MMNLLVREDKSIHFTNAIPLYLHDSFMNPLRILLPNIFADYSVKLEYTLPDDTVVEKDPVKDDEPYNDNYLSYSIDLGNEVTVQQGKVKFRLIFTNQEKQFTTQITQLSVS